MCALRIRAQIRREDSLAPTRAPRTPIQLKQFRERKRERKEKRKRKRQIGRSQWNFRPRKKPVPRESAKLYNVLRDAQYPLPSFPHWLLWKIYRLPVRNAEIFDRRIILLPDRCPQQLCKLTFKFFHEQRWTNVGRFNRVSFPGFYTYRYIGKRGPPDFFFSFLSLFCWAASRVFCVIRLYWNESGLPKVEKTLLFLFSCPPLFKIVFRTE